MKIGSALKYYRNLYKFTQSEVAELSGINEKYLGRIERNESVPTIDKVEQLCLAFDIRLSDLLMTNPPKISVQTKYLDNPKITYCPKIIYYCNCCGCFFQPSTVDIESDNIHCLECGCLFDPDNEYIEKMVIY